MTAACALGAAAMAATAAPQLAPVALESGIVINIPQRALFLMADGRVVVRYRVGLGRPDWPTFVGTFAIVAKETNPVWHVPLSIQEELRRSGKRVLTRVPPGPSNPLGKYWLGLSVAGYGIHGTNAPSSISTFQSHGCIRMLTADIEDLFARVGVGTAGVSVYEPIVVALRGEEIWMEAHPDVYDRDRRDPVGYVTIEAARLAPTRSLDMDLVARILQERAGVARRIDD